MEHLTLSDGRRLDYRVNGPEDGRVLLVHHGTPGSGSPHRGFERITAERGLRVVTTSRAGYGLSDRHPGRRVVDVVEDSRQLLDHLGVQECLVTGGSGGGPHALACAARLEGVRAVAAVVSIAPPDAEGLAFTAGMGEDNIVEFGVAREGEACLRPLLEAWAPGLTAGTAEAVIESMRSILPDVDVAVITGELAEDMVAGTQESLRAGVDGWVDDDLAFCTGWGFDLEEIEVPVSIWAGGEDLMVPYSHAAWLVDHVPGATDHRYDAEGHLSLRVHHGPAMVDDLLAAAGWS